MTSDEWRPRSKCVGRQSASESEAPISSLASQYTSVSLRTDKTQNTKAKKGNPLDDRSARKMKRMRSNVNRTDIVLIGLILIRFGVAGLARSDSTSPTSGSDSIQSASVNLTEEGNLIKLNFSSANEQIPPNAVPEDYTSIQQEEGGDQESAQTSDRPAGATNEVWAKIRHLHQKVRLKEPDQQPVDEDDPSLPESQSQEWDYIEDSSEPSASDDKTASVQLKGGGSVKGSAGVAKGKTSRIKSNGTSGATKPFRIQASGSRKSKLLLAAAAAVGNGASSNNNMVASLAAGLGRNSGSETKPQDRIDNADAKGKEKQQQQGPNPPRPVVPRSFLSPTNSMEPSTGAPKLENKFAAMGGLNNEARFSDGSDASESADSLEFYVSGGEPDTSDANSLDDPSTYDQSSKPSSDIMTTFLRIVESQSLLGDNCTAGTDFNLGEGVVDRYAQERFRLEADVAVNRANWLTRLWKYADKAVLDSEYLLHATLYSMIEMDEDIFAAGNCYDKYARKKEEYLSRNALPPFLWPKPKQEPVQGLQSLLSVRLPNAGGSNPGQGSRRRVQILGQHFRMVLHRPQERRACHPQHDVVDQR